jgi:hypothetical protein
MAYLGPKCALLVATKNRGLLAANNRISELFVRKHIKKLSYDYHASLTPARMISRKCIGKGYKERIVG